VKKIILFLCSILLFFSPLEAGLPVRPITTWGGLLIALVGAGVLTGASLRKNKLEKIRKKLLGNTARALKGNQRWQNQLKLHSLENSLENNQFLQSLAIAGLAIGGGLTAAGVLWPKKEEGSVDSERQPLMPGGSGVSVDPALDLGLHNSLKHQSGRYGPGNSLVDSSLPPGAGVGLLSGSMRLTSPELPKYEREKMYLVVPSQTKEDVAPVKDAWIESARVRIVTVPGDGHCLLYSLLFFNWLKDHPGGGIPEKFALQAKLVSLMRNLICNEMQKKVDKKLENIGKAVRLLGDEVGVIEQLPYQFLINRVKEFYTLGVVTKFCLSSVMPSSAQFSFEEFQRCFDTAVLLKTFLAVSAERIYTFKANLDLVDAPNNNLNVLEYVHFLMSPICQGMLEDIQKYLKQRVTVHELARSYMALYREHIACEVPVFQGTDIPKGIDSQYYLGDCEAEFLAGMLKTKIYVYFCNRNGAYSCCKIYGSFLGDSVPTVSLVNINSNHWAPLVVSGSAAASVGAGAAAGST